MPCIICMYVHTNDLNFRGVGIEGTRNCQWMIEITTSTQNSPEWAAFMFLGCIAYSPSPTPLSTVNTTWGFNRPPSSLIEEFVCVHTRAMAATRTQDLGKVGTTPWFTPLSTPSRKFQPAVVHVTFSRHLV